MSITNGLYIHQTAKDYVIKNSAPPGDTFVEKGQPILVWAHFPALMDGLRNSLFSQDSSTSNVVLREYVNYHSNVVKEVTATTDGVYSMYLYPGDTVSYHQDLDGYDHNRISIYLHNAIQHNKEHGFYLAWSTLWY